MTTTFPDTAAVMRRALELARRGEGSVEPNPMVGAVIVDDQLRLISEGWHRQLGGPHAEVHALTAAGDAASGATIVVTLEPCNHHGRTPPCTEALLAAGIRRVVVGAVDPASHGSGAGIQRLQDAGVAVETGVLGDQAEALIAPFRKQVTLGLPWVIAKWAMTLDGRIATRTGSSKWISGEASRARVHQLRGRVDAIVTGRGTVVADDPLLTARPPGPRTPLRVVLDSQARLPLDCRLLKTSGEVPVLVAVGPDAAQSKTGALRSAGAEVVEVKGRDGQVDLESLLQELGRRDVTNVLIEAGGGLLGTAFDDGLIDEVHVFVAPRLVGGQAGHSPIGGAGLADMLNAANLSGVRVEQTGDDVYVTGRLTS